MKVACERRVVPFVFRQPSACASHASSSSSYRVTTSSCHEASFPVPIVSTGSGLGTDGRDDGGTTSSSSVTPHASASLQTCGVAEKTEAEGGVDIDASHHTRSNESYSDMLHVTGNRPFACRHLCINVHPTSTGERTPSASVKGVDDDDEAAAATGGTTT